MEGLAFYPRYVGDYARKTKHLTMLEHGAFNLLLDHYYATGRPLLFSEARSTTQAELEGMPDHSRLYRLCSAITKEEQSAVETVLKMFFYLTDDGYRNSRADQTLEEQREKHAKKVNAGRKGGLKTQSKAKSKTSSSASSSAKATLKQPEPEPEPNKNYNKNDFDRFFKNYPKQTDPYEAEEAFKQAVEEGEDVEIIIEAARQYGLEQADNEKKYIKSPVSFLDKKVFKSPEYQKPKPKPVDVSKWEDWQKRLSQVLGVAAVKSWFLTADLSENVLYVEKVFQKQWIKNNYAKEIDKILKVSSVEVREK